MRKSIQILSVLIIIATYGCKKDNFQFPNVPFRLDLGIYSDLGLLGPGELLFKDGYGVQGLIIYRDFDNNYLVFDRACTYEKDFSCKLNKDTSIDGALICPCCKSRFVIIEESADRFEGPATHPLVRYNAFIDGTLLRISN